MSQKQTPKSCSCSACRRGKAGNDMVKLKERAFRHAQKISLSKSRGDYHSAPIGGYFD